MPKKNLLFVIIFVAFIISASLSLSGCIEKEKDLQKPIIPKGAIINYVPGPGGWDDSNHIDSNIAIKTITDQDFDESAGIFKREWNAGNFAGFWRDMETGASGETLVIKQNMNNSNRKIEKHNLVYRTEPVSLNYQVYRHTGKAPEGTDGMYQAVGWMGEKYVYMGGNRLAKIIFEQNESDEKEMTIGESWELGDGYRLTANSISAKDAGGRQAWITLYREAIKLDDKVMTAAEGPNKYYTYKKNLNDSIPQLITYYARVASLPRTDAAYFKYTWLRSNDTTEIKPGDVFGVMEVTSSRNGIIELKNKESIELVPGSTITLMENISIHVGNSTTHLQFYPDSTLRYGAFPSLEKTLSAVHTVLKTDPGMMEVLEDYILRDYRQEGSRYTISAYPKRGGFEERIVIDLQSAERVNSIEIIPVKGEVFVPILVAVGESSGYEKQTFLAINSREEWETVWQKHAGYLTGTKPSLPDVDFNSQTVIAIFQGDSPYDVSLINITTQGGNVFINLKKTYPAGLESARPYIIYRIPKRDNVSFRNLKWEHRTPPGPTIISTAIELVSQEYGIQAKDLKAVAGDYLDFPRTGRKIWKGTIVEKTGGREHILYLDESWAKANITEIELKEIEKEKFEKLDMISFELIWNASPDDMFEAVIIPKNINNNIGTYLSSKGFAYDQNLMARMPRNIIQELSNNDEVYMITKLRPWTG